MVTYNEFNLIVSDDLCEYANKRLSKMEQRSTMSQQMELNKMNIVCESDLPTGYFAVVEDDLWYDDKEMLKDFLDEMETNLFGSTKF